MINSACVWAGSKEQNSIYFEDILRLCKNDSLYGNVIDCWAKIHCNEQMTLKEFIASADKCIANPYSGLSYCFPTVWQFAFRSDDREMKKTMIYDQLDFALRHRFVHFPINLNEHWTIAVFDIEGEEWKHYNSLRLEDASDDHYYAVVDGLMEVVDNFQHKKMDKHRRLNLDSIITTQDNITTKTSVADCPQQLPYSNDCAVAVCNIISQHTKWEPVQCEFIEQQWIIMRPSIVEKFLNDPFKSWKLSEEESWQRALAIADNTSS